MQPGESLPSQNDSPSPEQETLPALSPVQSKEVSNGATNQTPDSKSSYSAQSEWKYREDGSLPDTDIKPVEWTASEFIDHEKQAGWFAAVGIIAAVIALGMYLFTQDLVSAVVIIMVSTLFAVFGARKPRILKYILDVHGIHIGNKSYSYNEFKSFAIMEEGPFNSVLLQPFKRIATPISLYYPPDQELAIVNTIGSYLPQELREHSLIDRLMRKVRF